MVQSAFGNGALINVKIYFFVYLFLEFYTGLSFSYKQHFFY